MPVRLRSCLDRIPTQSDFQPKNTLTCQKNASFHLYHHLFYIRWFTNVLGSLLGWMEFVPSFCLRERRQGWFHGWKLKIFNLALINPEISKNLLIYFSAAEAYELQNIKLWLILHIKFKNLQGRMWNLATGDRRKRFGSCRKKPGQGKCFFQLGQYFVF